MANNDQSESSRRVKFSLDFAGLVVNVLGFGIAIYTLHGAAVAFENQVYTNSAPWFLDLDKAFIDKPELRHYFYRDNTKSEPANDRLYRPRALAMAEYILDVFDSYLAQRTEYGHQSIPADWTNWMSHTFTSSPLLVRYLEDHKEWYQSGVLYQKVYLKWKVENFTQWAEDMRIPPTTTRPDR